tara:strand:+ start:637 stop:1554 length:918 start_codon:yes stop_codon:yes gene_type:complete
MKMFNKHSLQKQIGDMSKSTTLEHLKPVERYFLKEINKLPVDQDYDVNANEPPWFRTMSYTEIAHSFMMYPLSPVVSTRQMQEAFEHDVEVKLDYVKYLKDRIHSDVANKYSHMKNKKIEPRDHLIVPVGSNKLIETVCINKLKYIINTHGEDEVYLKPHPLTTHEIVGSLRDELGEKVVLDRDDNLYKLLIEAEVVYTSHRSESILYAVALGKEVDCIDVYQKAHEGTFFNIANNIFERKTNEEQKNFIQKAFNSYKSGIVNPELDENWKDRIDQYLDYIMKLREEYRYKYLWNESGTMKRKKE